VLVVLASRVDGPAAALVDRWPGAAVLLVPADLSRPGWRFDPDDLARSTAALAGRTVPCAGITGVLTLLPRVFAQELVHVVADDRRYVAAEMTAFLLAWLTALPCPVINRPHPGCLCGPAWTPDRWRHEAARRGLRVGAATAPPAPARSVTVVGPACLGEPEGELASAALRLASAAGADLLTVQFDPAGAFLAASPRPDVGHPGFVPALRRLLDERPA
jgi:hypothetical protein